MELSRQEYRSEYPFPSSGDLPEPGVKPRYPALQADSLPSERPGKPSCVSRQVLFSVVVHSFLLLFSCHIVSDFFRCHGLQHARPPCPSPSPGVCPSSCPLNQWCHPTISSSVTFFSFCLQSFPASGSFPKSHSFIQLNFLPGICPDPENIAVDKTERPCLRELTLARKAGWFTVGRGQSCDGMRKGHHTAVTFEQRMVQFSKQEQLNKSFSPSG